ncbi:MAG: hypothetical protein HQL54_13985 [Magnetococcales bacterium]|nr:hypothetical protein [Magnetococcales bacterium]
MAITLQQAKEKLQIWLDAEERIAVHGQSVNVDGDDLNRADLKQVAARIVYWEGKVKQLSGKRRGMRMLGVVR